MKEIKYENVRLPDNVSDALWIYRERGVGAQRPTEEGYEYRSVDIEWVSHKEVAATVYEGGRDCDGQVDYETEFVGKIDRDGKIIWSRKDAAVHDQFAEAAGC